jgi:hypothetical protein
MVRPLPIGQIGGVGKFYVFENSLLSFPEKQVTKKPKGVRAKPCPC